MRGYYRVDCAVTSEYDQQSGGSRALFQGCGSESTLGVAQYNFSHTQALAQGRAFRARAPAVKV